MLRSFSFRGVVAQQLGTADDAKAMLTKTVAALKADQTKTLELINKGEGGFLDREVKARSVLHS